MKLQNRTREDIGYWNELAGILRLHLLSLLMNWIRFQRVIPVTSMKSANGPSESSRDSQGFGFFGEVCIRFSGLVKSGIIFRTVVHTEVKYLKTVLTVYLDQTYLGQLCIPVACKNNIDATCESSDDVVIGQFLKPESEIHEPKIMADPYDDISVI